MNSQELRALQEAYSQVYELDEAGKNDARIRGNIKSFGSNYTPPRDWDQSANRGQGAVLNAKQKEKQRRKGLAKDAMGEAVDLYDIILSHLIDEGYAETPEAAEAIMVNMSEEWREDIMEISDKRVMAARNALAKRTDKSVGGGDGNQYSKNVSREARMNARIQSRNQRTGSNVEPTFTRRHQ